MSAFSKTKQVNKQQLQAMGVTNNDMIGWTQVANGHEQRHQQRQGLCAASQGIKGL